VHARAARQLSTRCPRLEGKAAGTADLALGWHDRKSSRAMSPAGIPASDGRGCERILGDPPARSLNRRLSLPARACQSRPQHVQPESGLSGVMASRTRPSAVSARRCSSSSGTATPCFSRIGARRPKGFVRHRSLNRPYRRRASCAGHRQLVRLRRSALQASISAGQRLEVKVRFSP
jgi:hypothetical protein